MTPIGQQPGIALVLSTLLQECGQATHVFADSIDCHRRCKDPVKLIPRHTDVIVLEQLPVARQAEHTRLQHSGQILLSELPKWTDLNADAQQHRTCIRVFVHQCRSLC